MAGTATIAGRIEGDVSCRQQLILKPSSQIAGDIKAGQAVIDPSALVGGNIEQIYYLPKNPL